MSYGVFELWLSRIGAGAVLHNALLPPKGHPYNEKFVPVEVEYSTCVEYVMLFHWRLD